MAQRAGAVARSSARSASTTLAVERAEQRHLGGRERRPAVGAPQAEVRGPVERARGRRRRRRRRAGGRRRRRRRRRRRAGPAPPRGSRARRRRRAAAERSRSRRARRSSPPSRSGTCSSRYCAPPRKASHSCPEPSPRSAASQCGSSSAWRSAGTIAASGRPSISSRRQPFSSSSEPSISVSRQVAVVDHDRHVRQVGGQRRVAVRAVALAGAGAVRAHGDEDAAGGDQQRRDQDHAGSPVSARRIAASVGARADSRPSTVVARSAPSVSSVRQSVAMNVAPMFWQLPLSLCAERRTLVAVAGVDRRAQLVDHRRRAGREQVDEPVDDLRVLGAERAHARVVDQRLAGGRRLGGGHGGRAGRRASARAPRRAPPAAAAWPGSRPSRRRGSARGRRPSRARSWRSPAGACRAARTRAGARSRRSRRGPASGSP